MNVEGMDRIREGGIDDCGGEAQGQKQDRKGDLNPRQIKREVKKWNGAKEVRKWRDLR